VFNSIEIRKERLRTCLRGTNNSVRGGTKEPNIQGGERAGCTKKAERIKKGAACVQGGTRMKREISKKEGKYISSEELPRRRDLTAFPRGDDPVSWKKKRESLDEGGGRTYIKITMSENYTLHS